MTMKQLDDYWEFSVRFWKQGFSIICGSESGVLDCDEPFIRAFENAVRELCTKLELRGCSRDETAEPSFCGEMDIKNHWNTGLPPRNTPILVAIETNTATRYYACSIDDNNDLVDDYGDDIGWEVDAIDRWCDLLDIDDILSAYIKSDLPNRHIHCQNCGAEVWPKDCMISKLPTEREPYKE